MDIAPWELFIRSTALHAFVQTYEPWLWPLLQSLHYLGASLLIGTVGLFDLRVLGLVDAARPESRDLLDGLLLMDVGNAQGLLGMEGRLSSIDLILQDPARETEALQRWLQDWIYEYVDGDPVNSTEETKSRKPLADARVEVFENEENPGYYSARFYLRPHYQLEGMDIGMSLVSRLPAPAA